MPSNDNWNTPRVSDNNTHHSYGRENSNRLRGSEDDYYSDRERRAYSGAGKDSKLNRKSDGYSFPKKVYLNNFVTVIINVYKLMIL